MALTDLLTQAQILELLDNGQRSLREETDFKPVVKLFTPDAGASWLLTEILPDDHDIAFGLADLGLGFPELGYVSLSEILQIRGRFGLPVERDLYFRPEKTLSEYAEDAKVKGRIVA